jgi:hypothetical protein
MTARYFDANIRSTYHFLQECKLVRSAYVLKSKSASVEFRELALTPEASYRDLFLCGLRNSDYNFLLSDYSYFQFSFTEKQRYRFGFYPNPFAGSRSDPAELDELLQEGIISFEEYSETLAGQPYEISKPLVRFDLDCGAYVRLTHPAAHLHVGMHNENRWPVCRCLTPRSFALLIVKLYYGNNWARGKLQAEQNGFANRFDRYFVKEKAESQALGADLFHEHEKGQVHLA